MTMHSELCTHLAHAPLCTRTPYPIQTRIPLKTFLKRFVARQYGLKTLAQQQTSALRASLLRYAATSARCRVFGWLSGAFIDEMPTGEGILLGGGCTSTLWTPTHALCNLMLHTRMPCFDILRPRWKHKEGG